jgi:hypothetical protein
MPGIEEGAAEGLLHAMAVEEAVIRRATTTGWRIGSDGSGSV